MEIAVKRDKMKRRNSKAAQVSGGPSADEVKRALEKYERALADLVSKHKDDTLLIEDDSVFENE